MSRSLRPYVMTNDTGFAPCIDREGKYLTLCTCEGYHIRQRATVEDWIMGSVGKQLARNVDNLSLFECVVFLAKITECASFTEYWHDSRFEHRSDRVYEPCDGGSLLS